MIRPWHLVPVCAVTLVVGLWSLWGRVGLGVGCLIVSVAAGAWCWILLRSADGRA